MFSFVLPVLNPYIIEVGPLQIRWYSLAYILGILGGLYIAKRINRTKVHKIKEEVFDDWIVYAVIGIVLGGRIGYTLFYNFSYYIHDPLQIFAVWNGGMSFHGGFIGSAIAIWLLSKKYKIQFLEFCDIVAVVAPIGLFLGRIANFVNMELYGRVTDMPWGVIFPNGGDLPRHPSQLYEAGLEGLLLFMIMMVMVKKTNFIDRKGFFSGLFLIGYSLSRMIVELFREPDTQVGFLFGGSTMGQLLSLPMLFIGAYLIYRAFSSSEKN